MKAIVLTQRNKLEYKEIPMPQPKPGQALVHVDAAGICGSDVHGYLGLTGRRNPPMIMGHESAGTVTETKSTRYIRPGQKVAIFPYKPCNECTDCKNGNYNACKSKRMFGVFQTDGAMCEYIAVDEEQLLPLPDGVSAACGALLEPLAVAYNAVKKEADYKGKNVVIIGSGTIGMMCMALIRSMGASTITMTDLSDNRLKAAQAAGADFVVNARAPDLPVRVRKNIGGKIHVVVEAVGTEKTVGDSLELSGHRTKVIVVGMSQRQMQMDIFKLLEKELTIEGSFLYSREDFAELLQRLASLSPLLESLLVKADLSEGIGIFERLAKGEDSVVKYILTNDGKQVI